MAAVLTALQYTPPAQAGFHLWSVNEIYSNEDGSVQFVEFATASNSQEFLNGVSMTCFGPQGSNVFRLPNSLSAPRGESTS